MTARIAILTIYNDGTMERADMSAGDLRNIGQQLIAMADNVMIRGTLEATNGTGLPVQEKETANGGINSD